MGQTLSMACGSLVLAQGLVSDENTPSLVHAVRRHLAHCHGLLDSVENEVSDHHLIAEVTAILGGFAGLASGGVSSDPTP
jgi:hypothetical protein